MLAWLHPERLADARWRRRANQDQTRPRGLWRQRQARTSRQVIQCRHGHWFPPWNARKSHQRHPLASNPACRAAPREHPPLDTARTQPETGVHCVRQSTPVAPPRPSPVPTLG
ncbi:uncharacterized protein STAUR_7061 [Stigmatella aurantiaca DW4/3-1]|uniref:Uncharacterized protein n=1 Tax=Stigmatella aurantiaca (strain DW4/3-1) TaxID=378806 RepID=E3FXM2_STIAD|nr:uncharacterized protein STAUR_7061 [Stigmatella aurantiaca DW4/3-1]